VYLTPRARDQGSPKGGSAGSFNETACIYEWESLSLLNFPKGVPMHRLILCLALLPSLAFAADLEYTLIIRDHRFEPAEIRIPSGKKIKLLVDNQDATAEEFESHELNREKVVPGKSKLPVFIGPLPSGRYPFYGDFHQQTATGVIIAE
jgi:hypothetical protein